ncbi:equatorin-like [Ornithorhynchus anatinus]|uniref:equatorin-like n=1 Tax=Ornithorhynchus anatinus TaxID=9258 RepID=UPI0010A90B05|nr:equatorin-like [Ornithorhynchus anatinus]
MPIVSILTDLKESSKELEERISEGKISHRSAVYRARPSSDLHSEIDSATAKQEDYKLKLLLILTLMIFMFFLFLASVCLGLFCRLKKMAVPNDTSDQLQGVRPDLAHLSYFKPLKGVSDTSFSRTNSSEWSDPSVLMLQK